MMRILFCMILAASLSACGNQKTKKTDVGELNPQNFPNVENSVYGAWSSDTKEIDAFGVTKSTNLYFSQEGRMGAAQVCETQFDKLVAGVTFSAVITVFNFTVSNDIRVLQKGGGAIQSCELTFPQGSRDFGVLADPDRLQIKDGKGTLTYTRIR